MTALLLFGLVLLLLVLRQPLLVILMSVAAFVHIVWGQAKLDYIIEDMWVGLDKEVILSIPLFILCGNVMTRGSIAKRLIGILASITRPLPGGMAVACILSCAVFAAISGSSIVTMLAIGTVMYPAMREAGYDLKFALGAIMSGGTLGIIIPPSIPMIIYGLVTETSVTDLFAAGFGPGILLTIVFSIYSVWVNRHLPRGRFDLAEFTVAVKRGEHRGRREYGEDFEKVPPPESGFSLRAEAEFSRVLEEDAFLLQELNDRTYLCGVQCGEGRQASNPFMPVGDAEAAELKRERHQLLRENVQRLRRCHNGFDETSAPQIQQSGGLEQRSFAGCQKQAVPAGFGTPSRPAQPL